MIGTLATARASRPRRACSVSRRGPRAARRCGISTVELLLALAISAVLLTGLLVSLDTSFHAYATAAESASAQSSSRLVMQRMLGLIRGGTLHDAYDPNDPAVTLQPPPAPPVRSVGIQMFTRDGELLQVWWQANAAYGDADLGDLWYTLDGQPPQPLLEQVRTQRDENADPYVFILASRESEAGLLLTRATVDLTVQPGADATLALEDARGASDAVRLVGSTMPRRNLDVR